MRRALLLALILASVARAGNDPSVPLAVVPAGPLRLLVYRGDFFGLPRSWRVVGADALACTPDAVGIVIRPRGRLGCAIQSLAADTATERCVTVYVCGEQTSVICGRLP